MSFDLCGSIVADSWLIPIFRVPPRFGSLPAAAGAGFGEVAPAGAAAAAVTTGLAVGWATAGAVVAAGAAGLVSAGLLSAGLAGSAGFAAGACWPQAVSRPAPAPTVARIRKRR